MHILYHHRTAGDRVEAVHILGIVRALRAMGHTVEISSPPGCDPERKAADPQRQEGRAPREGALRGRLKRFARKAPPWVFEAAELGYNAYSLFDMLRRRFSTGRPEMILERATSNSFAPTWLAGWWNIPIVQEVNVTTRIGRLRPLVLRGTTQRIERWVARRATLIVTVSRAFERMLLDDGFPAEKMLVCQNAIDPAEFDPEAVKPAARPAGMETAFIAGYVGAFVPWHRVDMMVESARELAPRYPRLRWLLVGDGVERPRIEKLLADCGLTDKFWLPGAVKHSLIPSYLMAMDAAVMPHSNLFGSPMKLFEYMAMGRPVVMPDVPPIAEVVEDGVNGMLFRAEDAAALGGALAKLVEDEAFRRRLGARARQDALERHTWSANARRLLEEVARRRTLTTKALRHQERFNHR
jgi:glycosyltransferase involved in cell wall biosynthesis